jgi:ribosome-binding protein aMBF1 (putative translation factor)
MANVTKEREAGRMMRLTKERQGRGWTRGELARRARMTPADVGKIEAGRLVPYDSQLRKLARALGIDAARAHTLLEPAA